MAVLLALIKLHDTMHLLAFIPRMGSTYLLIPMRNDML